MALALTGHPSYMYYKTQGDALGYVLDAPSGRAFHRSFGSPCSFGSLVRSVPSFVRICNPNGLNMSICNAKKITYRITNPNTQYGRITNPSDLGVLWL